MCGEPLPENRTEKLAYDLMVEFRVGLTVDENYNSIEFTAQQAAKDLETTPQMIGKVMKFNTDLYVRTKRNGKVVFIPKEAE